MLNPRPIHNVSHPFIDSLYLKKEFVPGAQKEGNDILVIEARRTPSKQKRDQLLLSFLADLDLIKDEVESKAGTFNRVDIRYC